MTRLILKDTPEAITGLLPLTYSRPVAALRCGIFTIAEKWARVLGVEAAYDTQEHLRELYPQTAAPADDDTITIAGELLPDDDLLMAINALAPGQALYNGERWLARRGAAEKCRVEYPAPVSAIDHVYDIFGRNAEEIVRDMATLPPVPSYDFPAHVTVIGDRSDIYVAPAAALTACVLNASEGPIYIGPGAVVQECSLLRGPVAVCEGASVSTAARIYKGSTIGPHCKVGGEVSNVVFQGYANKAHDGYLGNAVIGEWCNLGAGTNASNLKNDYTEIKLWDYGTRRFRRAGLQFCGLVMGDHSKAGVNTMFNTATTVGAGCNIHGAGFPRNFVKSFMEGGAAGFSAVPLAVFFRTAEVVMARRGIKLSEAYRQAWIRIAAMAQEIEG